MYSENQVGSDIMAHFFLSAFAHSLWDKIIFCLFHEHQTPFYTDIIHYNYYYVMLLWQKAQESAGESRK